MLRTKQSSILRTKEYVNGIYKWETKKNKLKTKERKIKTTARKIKPLSTITEHVTRLLSAVMDSVKHKIYILLFFGAFFGCSSLQTGIIARYFIKTSVRLDDLASRVRAVFSEHVRVTSSAMCATTCSETEWCSGYLVCKDRPKTLCVLLQVGANSGPATQNTSDYSSCSLYMPSDFRWVSTRQISVSLYRMSD